MKTCARVLLAALFLLGALAPPASAVVFSGRSSTQAQWFSDEFGADHFDLAEYLRATAREFNPGGKTYITGYGRVSGDVQQGDGVDGRLYYLYLDRKDIIKDVNVRIGRQFFFVSAGSALVDGARVDAKLPIPVTLSFVGGRNVLFSLTGEATRPGDLAGAVQLSLTNIPEGSLDISYFQAYDQSELAREVLGLAASKRILSKGEIYTQLRFDLLSEVWSEIQFGARAQVIPKLALTAEYFRSIPVFDTTSIFSVFAVNRFQEVMLRAQYELNPKWSLNGEYRNESYGDGATANAAELGARYRLSDATSLYGSGILRNGEGGHLAGFELSGDTVFKEKYLLSAGAQFNAYKRDAMTGDENASRIWLGGEYRIRKNISVAARLEENWNENFNSDLRARMALNVDF